jgi:hypothetical protein
MTKFNEILDRSMTRKEFLKTLGLGALAFTGISSVLGILSGHSAKTSAGYGSGSYGGTKEIKG